MKNTNVTKVLTVGIIIPIIALTSLYANANTKKETKITNESIELDVFNRPFVESKNILIESLQEELKYSTNTKLKNQIQTSLKNLQNINDEKNFFEILENEYNKIDAISEEKQEKGKEDATEFDFYSLDDKKQILSDLEAEVQNLVQDDTIKSKISASISELKNLKDETQFFDILHKNYDFLDTYYEKNNITLISENDTDFLKQFETIKGVELEEHKE